MTLESPRVHVAIAVSELDRSVAFYEKFFGLEPVKKRPGYAKFELQSPRMNFTLNETGKTKAPSKPAHYGIEVPLPTDVGAYAQRVRAQGLQTETENDVTCCYAVTDKFWAYDPDGHAWEVFAITQADVQGVPPAEPEAKQDESPCCPPTCCP